MITKEDIRKALKTIRCCRDDFCVKCPLQEEICDDVRVEMESLPAALVDKIEEIMEAALK
jgi:hypothetical protein